MTFIDYQELFQNCVGIWDLSTSGISGSVVQNIFTPGVNNGVLGGGAMTGVDRFGLKSCLHMTTTNYVSLLSKASFPFALTILMWVRPTSQPAASSLSLFGNRGTGRGMSMVLTPSMIVQVGGYVGPQFYTVDNMASAIPLNGWSMVGFRMSGAAEHPSLIHNDSIYKLPSYDAPLNLTGYPQIISVGSSKIAGTGDQTKNTAEPADYGDVMIFDAEIPDWRIKAIYDLSRRAYLLPVMGGREGTLV